MISHYLRLRFWRRQNLFRSCSIQTTWLKEHYLRLTPSQSRSRRRTQELSTPRRQCLRNLSSLDVEDFEKKGQARLPEW